MTQKVIQDIWFQVKGFYVLRFLYLVNAIDFVRSWGLHATFPRQRNSTLKLRKKPLQDKLTHSSPVRLFQPNKITHTSPVRLFETKIFSTPHPLKDGICNSTVASEVSFEFRGRWFCYASVIATFVLRTIETVSPKQWKWPGKERKGL